MGLNTVVREEKETQLRFKMEMGDKENSGWAEGAVTKLPSKSSISLSYSRAVTSLRNILVAFLCFDLLEVSTCCVMNDDSTFVFHITGHSEVLSC